MVVSHITSNKSSSVYVNNLASRLGVGISTALRTLEATTQRGVRRSNFSLEGRRLISRHDRLHYKRLHDRFYYDTTYVRPKFQSLHRDSCVWFSPQNTTFHGLSQCLVIPGKMLVTTCYNYVKKLVWRISSLPTIIKMFQDQAPSGLKYSVIRTYVTFLRSLTSIGIILLKDHGER